MRRIIAGCLIAAGLALALGWLVMVSECRSNSPPGRAFGTVFKLAGC